jgi:hypothetical protein
MKFLLPLLLVSLFSLPAIANAQGRAASFEYRGQPVERLSLNHEKSETRYRDETYQDRVCEDRTYYRNECRTVYDNVCRNETRYRQQCSTSPSRQVCTTSPSRQVCTTRPTRRVCRTNSRGQRVCRNVGGGRSCRTVPGRRTCRTVPGRRTCRQVPFTERICRQVARQVCSQVPYTRSECRDVTRTRRVPYQAIVASYVADVNVNFENYSQDQAKFKVRINEQGRVVLKLKREGQDVVTLVNEQQFSNPRNGVTEISAGFTLRFDNLNQYYAPLNLGELTNARVRLQGQKIIFKSSAVIDANKLAVTVTLTNNQGQLISKKINLNDSNVFKVVPANNGGTRIVFTPGSLLRQSLVNEYYQMHLNFEMLGSVLNSNVPYRNFVKTFENIRVIQ